MHTVYVKQHIAVHTLRATLTPFQLAGPLKRTGLLGIKRGGSHSSFGSQLSIYSAAGGGKGNYEITGEILVGIL